MSYLKSKYNQEFIRKNNLILGETIIGSHKFNLHNLKSDVDMYGIFYLHKDDFFSLRHRIDDSFKDIVEKVEPQDNDITYMEIGKFYELLNSNNPNALELLTSLIESSDSLKLDLSKILSKKCEHTFGNYAITQIKKARGLNKKIHNPVGKERKTPLNFCSVMQEGKTYDLKIWLEKNHVDQKFCGVVALSNARDSYALYLDCVSKSIFDQSISDENAEILKSIRRKNNLPMG